MTKKPIKIIAVSDTHNRHWNVEVPECDIFIYAGDAGIITYKHLEDFNKWLRTIKAKHRIIIMGNHDRYCEQIGRDDCKIFFTNATYLENEAISVMGIKFWASPYSVEFNGWHFMKYEDKLKLIWDLIPEKTDIVITHCPCRNILDLSSTNGEFCGSYTLRDRIKEIKPKIHICGHLHSAHGQYTDYKTDYYNVSVFNDEYEHVFEPTTIYFKK